MASLESARRSLAKSAPEEALREAKEVAGSARAAGNLQLVAEAVSLQGLALVSAGRAVEAQQVLGAELNASRSAGDQQSQAILLAAQSSVALAAGDAKTAQGYASEGRQIISRKGSSSEKQSRALLLRLHVAEANAHLAAEAMAPAAVSAWEALALARETRDDDGQCEALHVMALLFLFFGRSAARKALQEAAKGDSPFASLESSNQTAALLRRLGDKEGEAASLLFGVAEARLEQGNGLEAQGAARRAQELFRQLRHRRGRLAALDTLTRSLGLDTLATLQATEEELSLFESEQDVAGQVSAYQILADAYIARKIYGEARSALRKAVELLKGTAAAELEGQTLLLLSQVEDFMGGTAAALKSAEKALIAAKSSKAGILVTEARRVVSRLQTKSGHTEQAPNRRDALEALRDLTQATRRRDADEFRAVMARLEDLSGYTDEDVKAALIIEDDEDQVGLVQFLKKHQQTSASGAPVSKSRSSGSTVMTGMSHALLYLSFRMGGLGYGPRFRRCYGYRVEGEEAVHGVAYLRLLSSQEEWGRRMETQPPILDSMQHSLNAIELAGLEMGMA